MLEKGENTPNKQKNNNKTEDNIYTRILWFYIIITVCYIIFMFSRNIYYLYKIGQNKVITKYSCYVVGFVLNMVIFNLGMYFIQYSICLNILYILLMLSNIAICYTMYNYDYIVSNKGNDIFYTCLFFNAMPIHSSMEFVLKATFTSTNRSKIVLLDNWFIKYPTPVFLFVNFTVLVTYIIDTKTKEYSKRNDETQPKIYKI